jgi:hypothetical protein
VLFNGLVGLLVTSYRSYSPVFLLAGLMHPMSFLIVLLVVRRIEPVQALHGHFTGRG